MSGHKNLYKFIADERAVSHLLQGEIRFTPPGELNDPSELTPNVIHDEVVKSRERIRKHGYTEEDLVNLRRQENLFRLAPRFLAVRVPETPEEATALIRSPFYNQVAILEQRLNDMLEGVKSKVGLFCLSLRYDSLPMWAHYARNAAGLVVEFVDLEEVFKGDDTGVLSQPIAVMYDRDRRSVTFDTRSHESLFFAKFPDWSYEKEVRIVLPLADCREKLFADRHLHIRKIPRSCISRLILGWNMPKNVKYDIQSEVQKLNPEVKIADARIVHGRVELSAFRS